MKKIIKTLLVVMVLAIVVTAFTACDIKGTASSLIGKVKCTLTGEHIMEAFAEELPTCTESGWSAGVVCTRCGYTERNRFEIPATGHSMAAATCELPSTCEDCGHTEGDPLGHTSVDVAAVAPTCTTVGSTEGTACSVCKKTLSGCEEVPALGHTFVVGWCTTCYTTEFQVGDNAFNVSAELMAKGYHISMVTIPADGHYKITAGNLPVYIFTTEVTTEGADWTAGTGASWAAYDIDGEAYLKAGYYYIGIYYLNTLESSELTVNVAELDCTASDSVTTAPTCTKTGLKDIVCSVCGHVLEADVVIDALGHVDANSDKACDNNCGYSFATIAEALELADDTKVIVTGKVVSLGEWSTEYKNMNVTIADAEGNELYIFRLSTQVELGDTITVTGELDTYNKAKQIAQGATASIDVDHSAVGCSYPETGYTATCTVCGVAKEHTCEGGTATCTAKAICTLCGYEHGEKAEHTYVNNVCSACGEVKLDVVVSGTVSVVYSGTTYYVGLYDNESSKVLVETAAANAATITVYMSSDSTLAKIKVGDTFIAPKGGNTNGIKSEEYVWSYTVNEDGSYTFSGQGSDTVSLAYNHNNGSPMIRAYKNGTLTGSSKGNYSSSFIFTPAA